MVRSGEEPRPAGRATDGTGPASLRELFLQGDPVETGVRTSILNSWRRSRSLGLSPDTSDLPYREDFDPGGRIVRAALPVLDRLQATFAGSQVNISVADANGTVLLRRFGDPAMTRSLPAIQVVPGFVFAEQVAGTNGIGLALAERQLIRVYGAEHFAERSQQSACVALPVRDPLSGCIEGVLCLGYPRGFERPALGIAIRRAAEGIERRLLGQSSARERALLRTYLATGADTAGPHRGVALDALANEFHPRDQAILRAKAAELISGAQLGAAEVTLPDGRRVTLMSRPVTSASGVRGIVIEAVLSVSPAGEPLAIPHQMDELSGLTALAVPLSARPALALPSGHVAASVDPVVTPHRDGRADLSTVGASEPATATGAPSVATVSKPAAADGTVANVPEAVMADGTAPNAPEPVTADSRRPTAGFATADGGKAPAVPAAGDGVQAPAVPAAGGVQAPIEPATADSGRSPVEPVEPEDGDRSAARSVAAEGRTAGLTPTGSHPGTAEPVTPGTAEPVTPDSTHAQAAPAPDSTRAQAEPVTTAGTRAQAAPDSTLPEPEAPPTAAGAPTGAQPAQGLAAAGGGGAAAEHSEAAFPARGLVMLGEPQVGAYALAARRRLELLSEASTRIGTTLDVRRTAEELAETAVPGLADFVTIDLPDAVLRGEESADPLADLRRTVVHGIREGLPFTPPGKRVDFGPTTPQLRCLSSGEAVLEPDLKAAAGWLAQDPEHTARLLAHVHSLIAVPLVARGVVLGVAGFYRAGSPFGDDDRSLAQELASRAALSIDNARRYTHERTMVLALQRRLLPHGLPDQDAVEVAHRYLPAESDVGGDWYDVIPLSGARVGLLVGDVVGHGMLSAATMGRLRTAARSFAELDFPPEEVLTHLDNLVGRLDRDDPDGKGAGVIGATCLYAVYDPTVQRCLMARAGHPPPAVVRPDGTVNYPDLPAGPPLGLGGLPFDAVEVGLPAGSQLVMYTDGLIEDRHRDVDLVLEQLREALAHPERAPEETCQAVLDTVAPAHPHDDIALLVARVHALDPDRIATWELSADPALVGEVRASAMRWLSDRGLGETAFAAELILSELITNAIRHGAGPIRVRLLYRRTLICEVSDASNTAPHLRRAASTDEGGRGLFLVAQLSQSWGTRYLPEGKVIWAECGLDGRDAAW
ncbi:Serine phosphatase RsbU, regulator of sigma subunit [Streptomyces sp. Ag82_O1-12]|uniref:SpoIIE family protein phosphatase n=1 Tax=unclassified Streptomyces TaxID=2593676 RepID=UPI000BDDB4F1|nr:MULTISPECIES: SpoIIE family protein phosphatase [unclassified Streptomyces]SMQ14682.1 Serine phosphatase RsbU, regulator of sigma subunit [Streptomyces sp. Ag82_O1-12]SOD43708.1 Serine phosphatase RsbU, regulator of sigma subunit [Streptomyces sp. Ag82_G6-1]